MDLNSINLTSIVLVTDESIGVQVRSLPLVDNVVTYDEISSIIDTYNIKDVTLSTLRNVKFNEYVCDSIDKFKASISGDTMFSGKVLDFTVSSDLEETKDLNGTVVTVLGSRDTGVKYTLGGLKTTIQSNILNGRIKNICSSTNQHGNILVATSLSSGSKIVDEHGEVVDVGYKILYSYDGIQWHAGANLIKQEYPNHTCLASVGDIVAYSSAALGTNDYIYITKNPSSTILSDETIYDVVPSQKLSSEWCRFKLPETDVKGKSTACALVGDGNDLYIFSFKPRNYEDPKKIYDVVNVVVAEYKGGTLVLNKDLQCSYKCSTKIDFYTNEGIDILDVGDKKIITVLGQTQGMFHLTRNNNVLSLLIENIDYMNDGHCFNNDEIYTFDSNMYHPRQITHYDGKLIMTFRELNIDGIFESDDGLIWNKIKFEKDIPFSDYNLGGVVAYNNKLYMFSDVIAEVTPTKIPHKYEIHTIGNINF